LMTPIERRLIDYSDLEQGMAHLELVIRDTRRTLAALASGESVQASSISLIGVEGPEDSEPGERH
jgi:hypothetical protein